MFGVAMGSPLGGVLGKLTVTLPLQAGGGVMVVVAVTALALKLDGGLRKALDSMGTQQPKASREAVWSLHPLHVAPPFRLPYLFGFVDRFTIGVFIIAFMLYTAYLGHGPQTTGFLIGAFMIPFAFLSYPIGKLAEPLGLWRFVLVGSLLFGLAYGAIPWLSGWHLWVAMGVCGVLSAVMFGPNLMLVTKASAPQNRASAVAGFNAAGSLGFLVGPVTGGALLQGLKAHYSPEATFRAVFALVGATEVLCVVWGLWRLRKKPPPTQREG
jgi:MFS family permease